jgi:hypothetical protein
MSAGRLTSTHTLGAELERERLEHRVGRVKVAIAALRQRASEHQRELAEPPTQIHSSGLERVVAVRGNGTSRLQNYT